MSEKDVKQYTIEKHQKYYFTHGILEEYHYKILFQNKTKEVFGSAFFEYIK